MCATFFRICTVKMKKTLFVVLVLFSMFVKSEVLLAPEEFVSGAFAVDPNAKVMWLKAEHKQALKKDFNYSLDKLRVRNWGMEHRTAWILEEVGKEQPITMGVVIENDQIHEVKILIYRESRGDEVKHGFYTRQFSGAYLDRGKKKPTLSEKIDGITGATLSVRATKKMAQAALYLHQQSPYSNHDQEK